jgi:hypothetical protein
MPTLAKYDIHGIATFCFAIIFAQRDRRGRVRADPPALD